MPPNDDDLSDSEVGETTSSCSDTSDEPEVYGARWHHRIIACGDRTVMLARTRNIPIGTAATVTVKKISDNSVVFTRNVETYSTYFGATWESKKPDGNWNGPEMKFTAQAAGLSDDSRAPNLSFFRYPDLTGEYYRGEVRSVGTSANYVWDRLVYVRVIDRVMHIQVPMIVTARTVNAPEWGKLQTASSYESECERQPMRGDGNLTEAEKNTWKNWIHTAYRRKVAMHRERCLRHDDPGGCDCHPSRKCCKMEVKVWALFWDRGERRPASRVNYWRGDGRADCCNWYSGDVADGSANVVFPHEVGHLMGFYDEYDPDGAWGPNPPWQHPHFGYLMGRTGAGPPRIAPYYFDIYAQWLSAQTMEPWKAVPY